MIITIIITITIITFFTTIININITIITLFTNIISDYNTDFCDVLPKILANLYRTHLIIINENPITKEVVEVRVECERHGIIDRITYVHRKGNHYNGVVLSNIINSDCDNVIDNNVSTRISYSRDYLLKLCGSPPGIKRSERKHLFQYYSWRPRNSKLPTNFKKWHRNRRTLKTY